MAALRKHPLPPARMVALLTIEKRRLVAANGAVTRRDFDEAWERCWHTMVLERAWPHKTQQRRAYREAMVAARGETRASFLDAPTPFSFAARRLTEAAANMCLKLEPEQVVAALLAAVHYVEEPDREPAAGGASDAPVAFVEAAAA